MSRIFVSHSHRDNASAIALGRWLTDHGWSDFFLDISADRGLSPGERWQEALKRAADRCQAVLFLISDDWLQSRWCQAEFLLAKQLGKVIFGVLVRAVPLDALPPEMRNEWQLCDLVAGVERETIRVRFEDTAEERDISFAAAGLRRLRLGIERAGLDPSTFSWPPPSDPDRAPYSGLRAMDREDAAVFFGREAPITLALDALRRLRESGPERLFVVLGASGSGKSSFLRAGVLPRLARDDRNFFVLPVIRPERAAVSGVNGLLSALDGGFKQVRSPTNRADLRRSLDTPAAFSSLLHELQRAAQARLGAENVGAPSLVFSIDQAEELFATEGRSESDRLLALLQGVLVLGDGAGDSPSGASVFVLASIRSDSYERLQTDPALAKVGHYIFNLPPIPREEYKAVIEGPAARHDAAGHRLRIEPRLTAALLDDTQGADAIPLLAFTLERLFVEHGADGLLSLDDYRALGGVDGSIEAAVEAALADPGREPEIPPGEGEQRRRLRDAFIPWLARVDPETEERKRRVATWDEIPADSRPILERLVEQRLVLRDRRRLPGSSVDSVVAEVAHEALLRRWPMLTLWLAEDAEALKAIDLARRAAAEWVRHGRRESWLNHTTERLSSVESLLARSDLDRLLGDEGRAYIRACRKRDEEAAARALALDQERQENERRLQQAKQDAERERLRVAEAQAAQASERAEAARRLFRRTLLGAAIAVVFMVAAIVAAVWARNQQRAAERALGEQNVTEASRKTEARLVPEAVAHLAQAVRLVPGETVWRAALVSTLITNRWGRLTGDIRTLDPATSAVFSPDGRQVLVAAGDEAHLLDPATGRRIGKTLRHRNIVRDAQFSADGTLVVTASQDRTARVWNARTGEPVGGPIRHDAAVTRAAFTAGGRHVVTLAGGRTRVFDRAAPLVPVASSDVPPWGEQSEAGEQQPSALARQCDDGTILARVSGNVVALLDGRTGAALNASIAHTAPVHAVRLTSDCRFGVSLAGKEARVWDARTGALVAQPLVHAGTVTDVQFSPRAEYVATVSSDGARVWDLRTGAAAGEPLRQPPEYSRIAFSDNGQWVAVAAGRQVRTWSARADTPDRTAFEAGGDVRSLQISPDGERLLVSSDRAALVYRTATGERIGRSWRFAEDDVRTPGELKFSHDWDLAVALLGDLNTRPGDALRVLAKSARIWNVQTGERQGKLLVHRQPITDIAFSRDKTVIVTASEDTTARTWSATSGEPTGTPMRHDQAVRRAIFSADGTRIVTVFARLVGEFGFRDWETNTGFRVWNAATGDAVGGPMWIPDGIAAIATSPDGTRVLTASGTVAQLWDPVTASRVGNPIELGRVVNDVAYAPDGTRILFTVDHSVYIYDANRLVPIGQPLESTGSIARAQFTRDQQRLLIVTFEKRPEIDPHLPDPCYGGACRQTAALWDVPTGREADAPLLTRVAEILGGYRISELGAIEPVAERSEAAASVLRTLGDASRAPGSAEQIAHWLLADPRSRAVSPFAAGARAGGRRQNADAHR